MPAAIKQAVADSDREGPRPARPLLIELIGPPGAGKSSLLRELRARCLPIVSITGPSRARLARQLLKLAPLLVALLVRAHPEVRRSTWRELRALARIDALYDAIMRNCTNDSILVPVYGPFLHLAYLRRSRSSITRSEAFLQRLQNLEALRARMNVMTVWLDAADHVLLQRINTRSKPHPFKGKTLEVISGSLAAIRMTYHQSVESSNLSVVRFDTSDAPICEIVQHVLEAIQQQRSRAS